METDKFQNKYRIPSARLQDWDYSSEGAYFITICTKDRIHYFGEIENGKMLYTPVGAIANVLWYEIKNHAKNVTFGEFVVMPNHIHGILILNEDTDRVDDVETLHETSLHHQPSNDEKNEQMSNISPKAGSISTIIRSYKSAVTKHANRLGLPFEWQARFHDHIIRNAQSFDHISNYILNNPLNWDKDKFYGNE